MKTFSTTVRGFSARSPMSTQRRAPISSSPLAGKLARSRCDQTICAEFGSTAWSPAVVLTSNWPSDVARCHWIGAAKSRVHSGGTGVARAVPNASNVVVVAQRRRKTAAARARAHTKPYRMGRLRTLAYRRLRVRDCVHSSGAERRIRRPMLQIVSPETRARRGQCATGRGPLFPAAPARRRGRRRRRLRGRGR